MSHNQVNTARIAANPAGSATAMNAMEALKTTNVTAFAMILAAIQDVPSSNVCAILKAQKCLILSCLHRVVPPAF